MDVCRVLLGNPFFWRQALRGSEESGALSLSYRLFAVSVIYFHKVPSQTSASFLYTAANGAMSILLGSFNLTSRTVCCLFLLCSFRMSWRLWRAERGLHGLRPAQRLFTPCSPAAGSWTLRYVYSTYKKHHSTSTSSRLTPHAVPAGPPLL